MTRLFLVFVSGTNQSFIGNSEIAKKDLLDYPLPENMWADLHAIKDDYMLATLVVKAQGMDVPIQDYESVLVGNLVRLDFWIALRDDGAVEAFLHEIDVLRDV